MDSNLELICTGYLELFTQVATFTPDEDGFKVLFVEHGYLEMACDLLYTLKCVVDRLERLKVFEP